MKNIESLKIIDRNNTNYFNGLEYPNSLKKFDIEMTTFNVNGQMYEYVHQFVNLESLCFYSHQNVHFHPNLSNFKNLKIYNKKLGEQNVPLSEYNYIKMYDAKNYQIQLNAKNFVIYDS